MAVPPELTIANLSGEFIPDKALSDDADGFLSLACRSLPSKQLPEIEQEITNTLQQGVPWLLRKAISLANPKLTIAQSTNEDGVAVVDLSVVGIGGRTVTEQRVLNWEPIPSSNPLYGKTTIRSRLYTSTLEKRPNQSDEDHAYLNARIARDGSPSSWAEDEDHQHLHCVISNDKGGWTIDQVWGFEEINGKRYHTRRSVLVKGDAVERGRIVYNYVS
ncbi:hypothetical protein BDV12DRAFT_203081 [Aspergillus spectabilis]